MNYYWIFYLISVADGLKSFFDGASNWFTGFSIVFTIVTGIIFYIKVDPDGEFSEEAKTKLNYWFSVSRRMWMWAVSLCFFTWFAYVAIPSKRDCIIIVAGGAVGNFIMSDSSTKAIPSEFAQMLREKMRVEIADMKNPITEAVADTLKDKTREELIELLKTKK